MLWLLIIYHLVSKYIQHNIFIFAYFNFVLVFYRPTFCLIQHRELLSTIQHLTKCKILRRNLDIWIFVMNLYICDNTYFFWICHCHSRPCEVARWLRTSFPPNLFMLFRIVSRVKFDLPFFSFFYDL